MSNDFGDPQISVNILSAIKFDTDFFFLEYQHQLKILFD